MAEGTPRGCGRGRSWNRARWLTYVRAWSTSGLPVVEYCRQEGLHPSSFHRWRRLFGESGEALGDSPDSAEGDSPTALFERVEVFSPSAPAHAPAIEVVLAGERRIRVGADFEEETLRRLVRALEGLAC